MIDVLIDSGSDKSLVKCPCYAIILSRRLFSENVTLSGIDEDVVRSEGYFPYGFNVDVCETPEVFMFYISSCAYDIGKCCNRWIKFCDKRGWN